MPAPYQPHSRARQRDYILRLRFRASIALWSEQAPRSIGTALSLTGFGLALLVGFVVAAINHAARDAALLLLFGAPMLIFGGLFLLFVFVEWAAKRFIHTHKYCGCCTFYRPQSSDYEVGLCRADPTESYVERTHSCPYFRYSERAMVRNRLAEKPALLHQIRVIQGDNEQTGSDK
jgi:hypothetical protein